MESPLTHVSHGFVIALVLYLVMRFVLKQSEAVSQTRAIFIGLAASTYMVAFGHGMPTKINAQLL